MEPPPVLPPPPPPQPPSNAMTASADTRRDLVFMIRNPSRFFNSLARRERPKKQKGAPPERSAFHLPSSEAASVHRIDAHHRVGATVDLVDRAAVGTVIIAVTVPVLVAIGIGHAGQIAGDARADAQPGRGGAILVAAAEDAVDQAAEADRASGVGAGDFLVRAALAVIAVVS